jgi:hypothetical protein
VGIKHSFTFHYSSLTPAIVVKDAELSDSSMPPIEDADDDMSVYIDDEGAETTHKLLKVKIPLRQSKLPEDYQMKPKKHKGDGDTAEPLEELYEREEEAEPDRERERRGGPKKVKVKKYSARDESTDIIDRAQTEAKRVEQVAREEARRIEQEAREEARRIEHEARGEAVRIQDDARKEARRIEEEAREEARRIVASVPLTEEAEKNEEEHFAREMEHLAERRRKAEQSVKSTNAEEERAAKEAERQRKETERVETEKRDREAEEEEAEKTP